jgi:penicillin amidase
MIVSANGDVLDMTEEEDGDDGESGASTTASLPKTLNVHMGPYRRDRILSLLRETSKHTMETMKRIQTDTAAPVEVRKWLMGKMEPALRKHAAIGSESAKHLQDWNGNFEADSKGAVVYDAIYQAILDRVFGDVRAFGSDAWKYIKTKTQLVNIFQSYFDRRFFNEGHHKTAIWVSQDAKQKLIDQTVSQVLSEFNADETKSHATWGGTNELLLVNVLFRGQSWAQLLGYAVGPIPFAGGMGVVWQGTSRQHLGSTRVVSPSWRYISDLGNASVATTLPGGPSGDRWQGVLYTSGVEDIVEGKYNHISLP